MEILEIQRYKINKYKIKTSLCKVVSKPMPHPFIYSKIVKHLPPIIFTTIDTTPLPMKLSNNKNKHQFLDSAYDKDFIDSYF
jgi:hypothetical protein